MKYKLKYWYMATGMDWPQEYPEKIIEAESRDEAFYKYHKSNGIDFGEFADFMKQEKHVREWATTCKEVEQCKHDWHSLQATGKVHCSKCNEVRD